MHIFFNWCFIILLIFGSNLLLCIKENEPDPQPDTSYWTKKFGSSENDFGNDIKQTYDSGFIIVGETYFLDAAYDIYLIRTNSKGDKIWAKCYGGIKSDGGKSVIQTNDSGYIIAGITESYGAGLLDFYLIRTDKNGDSLWARTYGGTREDWCNSVAQTSDGGFIITGITESFGSGKLEAYLIRTNSNGDTLWTKTYEKDTMVAGNDVQQTTDGGFIIVGCTGTECTKNPFNFKLSRDVTNRVPEISDTWDVYLIRTDENGDTLWTRTYGGNRWDEGHSVHQTPDGGFIIAGETWSFGAGSADVYLICTDANGDTLWTKTYGGPATDKGYSMAHTKEGGFVITGESYEIVYLLVTNSNGEMILSKTYRGDEGNWAYGYSVQQTFDGGYIITGYTQTNGGLDDVYLIKQNKL